MKTIHYTGTMLDLYPELLDYSCDHNNIIYKSKCNLIQGELVYHWDFYCSDCGKFMFAKYK